MGLGNGSLVLLGGSSSGSAKGAFAPGAASARYMTNGEPSGAGATAVVGRLYYFPFVVPKNLTITEFGIWVNTTVATATARCGIYNDNGGVPGSQIVDFGSALDCATSTGFKSYTGLTQALSAGLIWLALVGQTANPNVTSISSAMQSVWRGYITETTAANSVNTSFYQDGVTGALPATPTTAGTKADLFPRFFMKVQ